jgi:hypothetical protein
MVRDKLMIKKLQQERQLVKEKFCEEHQCDIESVVQRVDDLIATAVACGSSPQAYAELERGKGEFVNYLLSISEKYRVVAV